MLKNFNRANPARISLACLWRRRGSSSVPAITYLLYDRFDTDLAAGSVNGTLAEPTGGARTVVDTTNLLSITGGKAVCSNGKATYGDPAVWYPAITRVSGRSFFGDFNIPTSGFYQVGLDENKAANPTIRFNFADSGVLFVGDSNSAPAVGSYSAATYKVAIVLRTVGAYYFIKGGTQYPAWTLVQIDNSVSIGTLYPSFTNYNKLSPTADNIRGVDVVPPTPLAYDTFTRADGAAGSTETSGPDAQVTPSLAWSNELGTFTVASGAGKFSALDGGGAGVAALPTQATINVLHDAALTRSGGDVGIVLRWTDANNHVRAVYNGTNAQLIKVVAGTPTTLINAAATYGAGRVIRVICDGTAFRLYYNNALIGAQQTISNAALQAGKVGVYTTDANNIFDVAQVFARGTGGEYAELDKY